MSQPIYPDVVNPLADALEALLGIRPELTTSGAYSFNDLNNEDQEWIQDFCSFHCKPHWATGCSMLEAAELIVQQAVENANIAPKNLA